MATTLRFVILGDDRGGQAFDRFAKAVDKANQAVTRNDTVLKKNTVTQVSAGRAAAGLTSELLGVGGAFDANRKKMSLFTKALIVANLATGIAEPAIAAVTVATFALSGALVAAGAGAAAYGLALKPLLTQASTAMKAQATSTAAASTAQSNYRLALAAGVKPSVAMANRTKALAAANAQLAAVMKTVPAPVREFAISVTAAQDAYKKWADSLAKPVLAPLSLALRFVRPVLAAITPLVLAASLAFRTLVIELGSRVAAGGLTDIVQKILPHVVPSILNLAHAFGNVVAGIWGVIKAFLPFTDAFTGGLAAVTAKFKAWGESLPRHSGFKSLVSLWQQNWPLVKQGLGELLLILKNVASAFTGLATPANSKLMWQVANPLLALAVSLSAHPELVRALLYLYLIGKGGSQIKSVFDSMKTGWGSLSKVIALLTGGKVSLGMTTAGDTMLVASQNMQRAADTMAGASGLAGAGAKVPKASPVSIALKFAGLAGGGAAIAGGIILELRRDLKRGIQGILPDIPKWFGSGSLGALNVSAAGWANGIVDHFNKPLVKYFVPIRTRIANYFTGAYTWLNDAANKINDGLWKGLTTSWKVVGGWLNGRRAAITGYYRTAVAWLAQAGNNVVSGLLTAAMKRWAEVARWLGQRRQVVTSYFSHAVAWLTGGGLAVVSGLLNGINRRWPAVAGFLASVHGRVTNYFRNAPAWLIMHGGQVIGGLLNGITGRWPTVARFFGSVPGRIGGYFRGALNWLHTAGQNVIWGLLNGLQAVWHRVTSFISSIAGWIRGHKGPLSLDRRLLEPAGRALMSGLEAGLLKGAGGPLGFISGLTGTIGQLLKGGLSGILGMFGGGGGRGVARWGSTVGAALRMLGLPHSLSYLVLRQMASESGGNPTIVNRTDSNWLAGHPSVGLMQVIRGTFDRWAGPFRNVGPFEYGVSVNGLANIYAALNYAKHGRGFGTGPGQVGSMHGYLRGGPITEPIAGLGLRTGTGYQFHAEEYVVPKAGLLVAGGGGGNTYNITVQVPPTANLAAVGRAVVEAIGAFEKTSGARWRK